jgi:hypothetical protein
MDLLIVLLLIALIIAVRNCRATVMAELRRNRRVLEGLAIRTPFRLADGRDQPALELPQSLREEIISLYAKGKDEAAVTEIVTCLGLSRKAAEELYNSVTAEVRCKGSNHDEVG